MPQVSVILPTYNRAHLLLRSMDSVLNQTFGDLELIVVDDASTDNTREVVTAIADPRVRYLPMPRNGGPGYARNRGIEAAQGTFIAFQDSDDEWLPQKLEKQLNLFGSSAENLGMVCGTYIARMGNGRQMRIGPDRRCLNGEFEHDLLVGFRFITPTWLVRRDCLLEAGLFDEELPNREDWELVFRIYPRWQIRALQEPVTIKHTTANSVESNQRGRIMSYQAIMQRHAARWAVAPQLKAIHYLEMARSHIRLGEHDDARTALKEATRLRPLWPSPWLLRASMIPGLEIYPLLRSLRHRFRK